MRVKFFLIVALVIFTLPCMELPAWAGMFVDASNDFVLAPSRRELAGHRARRVLRPQGSNESRRILAVVITSIAVGNIGPSEAHFLPDLLNVQRK
jgi:hypothetical protein